MQPGTTDDLPTSIIYAPTTSISSISASGIPTSLPGVIQNPQGLPDKPVNSTLIQVGFKYGLNYKFVVENLGSAAQIFYYLPLGLSYGLQVDPSNVQMYGLTPYDTASDLGYITTLALAYIPNDMVNTLQADIHNALTNIYNNPSEPVHFIMSMIDPTITIIPGGATNNNPNSGVSPGGGVSDTFGTTGGAPIGGSAGASKPVSGSSVGIGMGAVAGAAVYAAAMVLVARRYRNKRQLRRHQRSSSVPSAERAERAERQPMSMRSSRSGGLASYYYTSGGRGINSMAHGNNSNGRSSRQSGSTRGARSVREQGISAPVMAENSLGWN